MLLAERVLAARSVFEQTRYPWLLVLDDVDGWDNEVLASVIPAAGNGQVVITSQNPLWDQPVGAGIREVSSLPVEFAASFLCARARRDDRLGAVAVAQRLGGLPLALEQAARFLLTDRKLRFGEYLRKLEDGPRDFLDLYGPDDHRVTVWRTWKPGSKPPAELSQRPIWCCPSSATSLLHICPNKP